MVQFDNWYFSVGTSMMSWMIFFVKLTPVLMAKTSEFSALIQVVGQLSMEFKKIIFKLLTKINMM